MSAALTRPRDGRAVLVTGASTGLGLAAALHLDGLGFRVYAGVRDPRDGARVESLASPLLRSVVVDVTDRGSIDATTERVAAEVGPAGLWGLVNNAGICVASPLECVPIEELRLQLETNFVGAVAVTQALLPLLRAARGRIVNVSSGLGRVALPFLGAYAASQFAKEAATDALRRELAPLGVHVVLVRPGAIATPIWDKLAARARALLTATPEPIAAPYRAAFLRFVDASSRGGRASSTSPDAFARAVGRALTSPRPAPRYVVGLDARGAELAARLLPDRALDALLARTTREDTG